MDFLCRVIGWPKSPVQDRAMFAAARRWIIILAAGLLIGGRAAGQFIDNFDGPTLKKDPSGVRGWAFFTGEGKAVMDLRQGDGFASIFVDATADGRNVWWALIKHGVSDSLDLAKLRTPGHALRVEARIRTSHAPRRVNLHLNTQKTTDFHTHLMEFDIPDTENWHTISMTTIGFDAGPGDTVNGQMALMDWGLRRYRVDIDYFRVDVVHVAEAGPDRGAPVPYHPAIPDPRTFSHSIVVSEDTIIDSANPDVNLNAWYVRDEKWTTRAVTVGGTQFIILRWDLSAFAGQRVEGHGLLELTTRSLAKTTDSLPDFGLIRVVEILAADPAWDQKSVTFNSLIQGRPVDSVLNPQMIIDWPVTEGAGGKTFLTISKPVLQRLVDGRTQGLAITPLGAINASFYATEDGNVMNSARLYFNTAR